MKRVDKHIRQVRQRFGFDLRAPGSRRGKHTPPAKLPEIIFTEEKRGTVPTTSSAMITTTSSVTTATPSTSKSVPLMGISTGTVEQTIRSITIADPGDPPGERGRLPIISTVFSLSTPEEAEGTEELEMEIEYVSTVMKDFEPIDPKESLTGKDLQIKKEMVEEDLHPSPNYYSSLQYVYQNLKEAEEIVETSRGTTNYVANLQNCHSIAQIFKNMKAAYAQHAERVGKTLPEGWDTVNLEKSAPPRGMAIPTEEDPDYHPEPIDHLDPSTMGMRELERYITQFDREVQEINKL